MEENNFTPVKGSCLCGAVRFELTAKPMSLSFCHCSRCRKQSGLFSAVLMVRREDFRLTAGADQIRRYKPEAPFKHVRAFCGTCGSPLGDPSGEDAVFPVAASALDDDPGARPVLHQNLSAKPDWLIMPDDGVKRMDRTYGG
ncbi:MAG TPA: GFA family protein [Phenylobacterium sp.]